MIKLFKNLNIKQLGLMFVCIILIVLQVWLDLKLPDYMSEVTLLIQASGTKVKDLINPGGRMLLCALGSLVSSVIVGYFAATIAASLSKVLRKNVFNKVENLSMAEIKGFSTSSLITRTTNDITQVQMFFAMGLQLLIKAPIMAVWAICKIRSKSFQWSIATLIAVLILFLMIGIIVLLAVPRFKKIQKLTDNLNRITRENLKGIRVIRAFNAEDYEINRFEKANNDLTNNNLFAQRVMAIMSPVMSLIMSGLTLAIYTIGAYLINEASLTDKFTIFTNMIIFSSYAMQVIMSFIMLAMVFLIYPRASVSAKRIREVLDSSSSIIEGDEKKYNKKDEGVIEFNNVLFKYPDADEYILENISFKVNKGETIAFIGSTGSGKSTLINLVPRFYDASQGEVLINGINVKNYQLEYLNSMIGYIPQKAVMFGDTINNNIKYGKKNGKKANKEDILNAIKIAQAKSFIDKLPEGLNSHVAEGGNNLSGGQKQRIAIARAIARKPLFYIFDDSFSALDYKTDYLLRKDLRKYTKDATVLIVAQRIGTIKNADKIVVLNDGKCVGFGSHSELLKKCSVYKEIAISQLSKEELENA